MTPCYLAVMTHSSGETDRILQVNMADRTVDYTVAEAAKALGVSEEFILRSAWPTESDQ